MINNLPQWHNNEQPQWEILSQDISMIASTSTRIKWVLDLTEQEQVTNSHNRLVELLWMLKIEVEKISIETSYNYEPSDYNNWLMYDRISVKKLFMERYLSESGWIRKMLLQWLKQNSESNTIKSIYIELMNFYKYSWNLELIKQKLYEEYFEDLAYEIVTNKNSGKPSITIKSSKGKTLEDIIKWKFDKWYDKIWLSAVRLDSVYRNKPDDFIEFIINIGKQWIKQVDFSWVYLSQIFWQDFNKFNEFIIAAWENWISSLVLNDCKLLLIFEDNIKAFNNFVGTAGKSWINSLNLRWNELHKLFWWDFKSCIEFIKTAWESWIKLLDLDCNRLFVNIQNDPELLIELIKTAWESWIKFMNLEGNRIFEYLWNNPKLINEFFRIAWESWIRSLSIWEDRLFTNIDKDPKLLTEFIKTAWKSWIRYLSLWSSTFYHFFDNNPVRIIEFFKTIPDNWLVLLQLHIFWLKCNPFDFMIFLNNLLQSWITKTKLRISTDGIFSLIDMWLVNTIKFKILLKKLRLKWIIIISQFLWTNE